MEPSDRDSEADAQPAPRLNPTLTIVNADPDGSDAAGGKTRFVVGPPSDRYHLEDFIGAGGMGEVFSGRDTVLLRRIALKYLKQPLMENESAWGRFWFEAVNSGVLDHPCVPPVHDIGVDELGRPFYVMRFIEGSTLRDVLESPEETRWSEQRLLGVFVQVCGAVQFAHEAGVLHLDLKPENIMIGRYGEVYLVDWGLSEQARSEELEDSPTGLGPSKAVRGTPAYMSPEQAESGQRLTAAADVFALGVVLYELILGRRPFPDDDIDAMLRRVRTEEFQRSGSWRECPGELRALIEGALRREVEQRTITAGQIADGVKSYLDGHGEREASRERARAALAEAAEELSERERLSLRASELERDLVEIEPEPWADLAEKRPYWQMQDERASCRRGAEVSMERALRRLHQAQWENPDDLSIQRAIADLYWQRLATAEAHGDHFQISYIEGQLRALDLSEIESDLIGRGVLSVQCEPRPSSAVLSKLVERDRVLTPIDSISIPLDQLGHFEVDRGRYQVHLECEGYRSLTSPVSIDRGQRVEFSWRFRDEAAIGADFVQVPGGAFVMGGDDETFKSVPRQIRHVDDFAIGRFPITWAEYAEFLQSLADDSPDEAERRLPEIPPQGPKTWYLEDGRVRFGVDEGEAQWPIFKVTYRDALDYCRWRSQRDGRVYRLLRDEEWEKAARGVDARWYPWGDRFDASFCKNVRSTREKSQPEDVGRYVLDCSPYGVRDMAGGIREWCDDWFSEKDDQRLVRGGSWNFDKIGARCAYRLGCAPNLSYAFIGFRLAHGFDD